MASTTIDAAQLDRVFDVDPAGSGVTVVISGVPFRKPDPPSALRYEGRGKMLKEKGAVSDVITFDEHYAPLVRTLLNMDVKGRK